MRKYKVLWFDDQHQTLEMIKDTARQANVQLVGYTNSMEGIFELLNNHKDYDSVILDGLFYNSPDHSGTAIDQSAFGEVAKVLSDLKAKNIIMPWFIYSGITSFVKDKNVLVDVLKDNTFANGKVFDKTNENDFIELLNEIKIAADKNPERIIKISHPQIFSIFENGLLPFDVEEQVLNILLKPLPQDKSELKAILTNIRSVQESIFLKLEGIKVLPRLSSTNQKIKHLSGNIAKGSTGQFAPTSVVYQTPEIENLQKWIYFTCSTYIHHLEAQHYDGFLISNYAVESLRSGLMELLLWFKKSYEENN
ncbi:MAG: response regulator [Flavobacterium sp.]|nr:MAG: response regulator [Flavobacterium sp.]